MKRTVLVLGAAILIVSCGRAGDEVQQADAVPDGAPMDVAQEAQRVRVGMTRGQVIQILGEPRTRVGEAGGERLTFWTYDGGQRVTARVYVTLDGRGTVVNVETVPL